MPLSDSSTHHDLAHRTNAAEARGGETLADPTSASHTGSGLDARPISLIIALLAIIADRLSKLWVLAHIRAGAAIEVIPGVFRITHVLNTGAAFSLFEDAHNPNTVRYALIGFSVAACFAVLFMLWKTGRQLTMSTVAFALILGGAIGNLYDRIYLHFVVDFLEVHIVHYHWPDFNVADSCIVVGAALLFLEALRPQNA